MDRYKLQYIVNINNLINILDKGAILPKKSLWGKDFVFMKIVPDVQESTDTAIYIPFSITNSLPFVLHPTSHIGGYIREPMWKNKEPLLPYEIKEYIDEFKKYDKNNNGIININDLQKILDNLGLPKIKKNKRNISYDEALYAIQFLYNRNYNCKCQWEYISPVLSNKHHQCRIYNIEEAINLISYNNDICKGGNEIGFHEPINVSVFKYIVIPKDKINNLSSVRRNKLLSLLKDYKNKTGLVTYIS